MQMICEGHTQIRSISQAIKFVLNRPTVLDRPVLWGESDPDASGASIYGSVIRDGGIFRMWYQAWPRDWNNKDVITVGCVESDDGLNWRRPRYGILDCMGSTANQLTDLPFHSPSVVIDPGADADRRYRAFGYSEPKRLDSRYRHMMNAGGYFTAHSADGLRWELDSPDPFYAGADVITSVWDPGSGCVRIALKTGCPLGGLFRRAFSTAEWSHGEVTPPVPALYPDDYDDLTARMRGYNSADYYGVGLMPTEGPTVGFLWNFRHQLPLNENPYIGQHGGSGCVDITVVYQLQRGGAWRHVSGRPDWLSTRDAPAWAGGAMYTAASPLEVGDETWLYYTGTEDRHGWCGDGVNYSDWSRAVHTRGGFAKIGLAKWKTGRLIGCQADLAGRISLTARKGESHELLLNAVTGSGGRIRVRLIAGDGTGPVAGYDFEDCIPLCGDHLKASVRWRGKDALPKTPAVAEIEITNGTLYSFEYTHR